MYNLGFKEAAEPETKLPTFIRSWRKQGSSRKTYFCFIDYAKAFDCVGHKKMWEIPDDMGVTDHLPCLLRNLYAGQQFKADMEQLTG